MIYQGSNQEADEIYRIGPRPSGHAGATTICPVCRTEQFITRCVIVSHDAPPQIREGSLIDDPGGRDHLTTSPPVRLGIEWEPKRGPMPRVPQSVLASGGSSLQMGASQTIFSGK